jgi:hypothetical protein
MNSLGKPWRHTHHDYQPIDEVRITTVPRYKQSGLSGSEWRISAKIEYLKKGRVIHEKTTQNVEAALRYSDTWLMQWLESGNYSAGRTDDDCDQEGCNSKATVTYLLKDRYTRRSGIKYPTAGGHGSYVRFCQEHRRRGDCGLEDADSNYEEVTMNQDGTLGPSPD